MSRNSSKVRKPFAPNAETKNAKLHDALRNVQDAVDALNAAGAGAENWADYETMKHFENQLSEFLSSDHGECGFEPYLKETDKIRRVKDDELVDGYEQSSVYGLHKNT